MICIVRYAKLGVEARLYGGYDFDADDWFTTDCYVNRENVLIGVRRQRPDLMGARDQL